MGRPSIKGKNKKRKQFKRVDVDYGHKKLVLDYLEDGHTVSDALEYFYKGLTDKPRRSKQQLISKWRANAVTIQKACEGGRARHKKMREKGVATVLSKEAEEEIVLWINTLRKDGAPVSRAMLKLKAQEVATECGLDATQFAASPTWMKLFMRRNRLSLRTRTRQGQTTPEDALEAAQIFRSKVLRTIVEFNCTQVFNADQTAVFFEYVPKRTITDKGTKNVWIRCGNKDKMRATAMLLGESTGKTFDPFIVFKSSPATTIAKQNENNKVRNGFGVQVWREVKSLQKQFPCRIYGNKTAWWNTGLSLEFLEYHFANRENRDDNVLLLWDDFSAHWTDEVVDYAASINVVLLKVPPRYTYVCQPADISWNKPFKGHLRSLWIDRLREQLSQFERGAPERRARKEAIEAEIAAVLKQLDRKSANTKVAALRRKLNKERFALVAPSRSDITKWISYCWAQLSSTTITSGFAHAGLLTDTRVVQQDQEQHGQAEDLIEALALHNIVDDRVTSDDDIGSACSEDDSEYSS